MTCTSYEFNAGNTGNIGRVILLSDSTPATFPTTTAGIAGLPNVAAPIVPGSLLVVVDAGKLYVMNERGTAWTEFGSASA